MPRKLKGSQPVCFTTSAPGGQLKGFIRGCRDECSKKNTEPTCPASSPLRGQLHGQLHITSIVRVAGRDGVLIMRDHSASLLVRIPLLAALAHVCLSRARGWFMVTVWRGLGPDRTVPSTPRPSSQGRTLTYLLTYLLTLPPSCIIPAGRISTIVGQ